MALNWRSRGIIVLALAGLSIGVPATQASAQIFVGPTVAGVVNVVGPVAIGNIINAPVVVSGGPGLAPQLSPIA